MRRLDRLNRPHVGSRDRARCGRVGCSAAPTTPDVSPPAGLGLGVHTTALLGVANIAKGLILVGVTHLPSVYATVMRTIFGVVFVAGSGVHLYLGLTSPSLYATFANTAWPPLNAIWTGFVMPNITWLALCMAAFELAVGVAAWLPGHWNRLAALAMTCFFAFLIVLGYALPAANAVEDILANRVGSVALISLLIPWLAKAQHLSVPAAWGAVIRRDPSTAPVLGQPKDSRPVE